MLKSRFLLGIALVCAGPVGAQPAGAPLVAAPKLKFVNRMPFPLVSRAQAESLISSPTLKFRLRRVMLRRALQELEKQSGIELDWQSDDWRGAFDRTLSLDLTTRSFNEALRAMTAKVGLRARLERHSNNAAWIVRVADEPRWGALQTPVGPWETVRLQKVSSSLWAEAKPGTNEVKSRSNSLALSFDLAPAPQLEVAAGPFFELTRAQDDTGRALLYAPESSPLYPNQYENVWKSHGIRVKAPAPDARSLARLEGKVIRSVRHLLTAIVSSLSVKGAKISSRASM